MIVKSKNRKMLIASIIANYFLQFITIISSLIIPRIIITKFGSEANGLIGSLNQFLSYITIVEGGLGGVFAAFMYKPLVNKDNEKISSVVKTAKKIYRKIALILCVYAIMLAIVYPLLTNSSFSYVYISSLTLILAGNMFIQYFFTTIDREMLKADKRMYVCSLVQSIVVILNLVVFVALSYWFNDLHILKLASAIVYLLQPIILSRYIRKRYRIDKNAEIDKDVVKSRWDGFSINIAQFIHDCTDVSILTIFTNLVTVSIYTVYAIVTTGARRTLQSISSALSPNIGQIYASGDRNKLTNVFGKTELLYFIVASYLFTVIGLLIIPFVSIYTMNVTDANYIQPVFAAIIIVSEFVFCIREPYFNLAQAAKRFGDIKKHAYIEAFINLTMSLILVQFFGLIGVAIGTLISTTYRTVYHILYLSKHIIHYSLKNFAKKLLVCGMASFLSIITCKMVMLSEKSIITFIANAALAVSITGIYYVVFIYISFFRKIRKNDDEENK